MSILNLRPSELFDGPNCRVMKLSRVTVFGRGVVVASALGLMGAFLGAAPAASADSYVWAWQSPVVVSIPGQNAFDAKVALSSDGGRQGVLWEQNDGSENLIRYATSTDGGETWDDSLFLSAAGRNAGFASLGMSADGLNVSAVWRRANGAGDDIVQASGSDDGGVTWADDTDLSAAGADAFLPVVAQAARAPTRVAAWERDQAADVIQAAVSDDSATWGDDTTLSDISSNSSRAQAAISANGQQMVVAWRDAGVDPDRVRASVSADGGDSWSSEITISNAGDNQYTPVLGLSESGQRVTVAYGMTVGGGSRIQVVTSDDSGSTWNAALTLSEAGKSAFSPDLAVSADGSVQAVAWALQDGSTYRVQVSVSTDAGVTWSTPVTMMTESTGSQEPRIVVSGDGARQALVWSDRSGSDYQVKMTASFDSGSNWANPVALSEVMGFDPSAEAAISADGQRLIAGWTDWTTPSRVVVRNATVQAIPTPQPVPAPVPPSVPLGVSAEGGDGSALISWAAPVSSGSFPVTNYQVSGTPAGSCLVPAATLSCEISGLRNGVEYSFRVRALSGAGWGAWSGTMTVVPEPPAPEPSMVITGSRDGGAVVVDGVTTGLVGAQVTPWIRFPGPYSYEAGSGVRTVSADGAFTWERETRKKTYVYFRTENGLRSNRVVIPAR